MQQAAISHFQGEIKCLKVFDIDYVLSTDCFPMICLS